MDFFPRNARFFECLGKGCCALDPVGGEGSGADVVGGVSEEAEHKRVSTPLRGFRGFGNVMPASECTIYRGRTACPRQADDSMDEVVAPSPNQIGCVV